MFQRSRSAINHRQPSLVQDRGYKTKLLVKHSTKELNLGKGEGVGREDQTMSGPPYGPKDRGGPPGRPGRRTKGPPSLPSARQATP